MGFQEEPQLPGTVLLPGPGSVQIGSVREIGGSTQKKNHFWGPFSLPAILCCFGAEERHGFECVPSISFLDMTCGHSGQSPFASRYKGLYAGEHM
jgi:hypothetical protein